MGTHFSKVIRSFDNFGETIDFKIMHSNKYTSIFGGCVSFVLYLVVLAYTIL